MVEPQAGKVYEKVVFGFVRYSLGAQDKSGGRAGSVDGQISDADGAHQHLCRCYGRKNLCHRWAVWQR